MLRKIRKVTFALNLDSEDRRIFSENINIVEINQDFLEQFTPDLTRPEIIEEIRSTFGEVRKRRRKDLVLDVKGVIREEEEYIHPQREYCD